MLPLNYRVMEFFDTVEEKYHQCAMYNLYNSDAFYKAAYNYEKNTDSWCYEESNERHPDKNYTRCIEVKEGTYCYHGNIKGSSYGRGSKIY